MAKLEFVDVASVGAVTDDVVPAVGFVEGLFVVSELVQVASLEYYLVAAVFVV